METPSNPHDRTIYLARVADALDEFIGGEHVDPMTRRDSWSSLLTRPLPDEGIGGGGVIEELVNTVIPNEILPVPIK